MLPNIWANSQTLFHESNLFKSIWNLQICSNHLSMINKFSIFGHNMLAEWRTHSNVLAEWPTHSNMLADWPVFMVCTSTISTLFNSYNIHFVWHLQYPLCLTSTISTLFDSYNIHFVWQLQHPLCLAVTISTLFDSYNIHFFWQLQYPLLI